MARQQRPTKGNAGRRSAQATGRPLREQKSVALSSTMHIITVINAKGGCGKSTIAMNLSAGLAHLGYHTLLIDMDPQAQVTQWLGLGDGLTAEGTLVMVMAGQQTLEKSI